jgi:hypothetical protein
MRKYVLIGFLAFLVGCVTPALKSRINGYEAQIDTLHAQLLQADEVSKSAILGELSRVQGALSEAQAQASEQIQGQIKGGLAAAGGVLEGASPLVGLALPALAPLLSAVGAMLKKVTKSG